MKKVLMISAAIGVFVILMSSFSKAKNGSIKGFVSPANAATKVVAFSETDTVRSNVFQGTFLIPNLRSGTYSLLVEATPPYKNGFKTFIMVVDGVTTDVGYFIMKK